jgi:hypothetical protein
MLEPSVFRTAANGLSLSRTVAVHGVLHTPLRELISVDEDGSA